MATTEVSQFDVATILTGGGNVDTSQYDITVIYNFPSERIDVSQYDTTYVYQNTNTNVEVSQWDITVVYKSSIDDPVIRVWTYTMDGHDYYIIRLGNYETLVYDIHSEQWYTWGTENSSLWRPFTGMNWQGGNSNSEVYGSNVIVGDSSNGALYFLDPDGDLDDGPVTDINGETPSYTFERTAYGQYPTRGYDVTPCWSLKLMGSAGEYPEEPSTVNLSTSDDWGHTYKDWGDKTTPVGDYTVRIDWRSLGSIRAPGRIFRITDHGALKRIDSLEMGDYRGG
jgi:hypothetical protein